MTEKYRTGYWVCTAISWLLVLGPLAAYAVYGFCNAEVAEKAALGLTVVAAVFLTVLSILLKFHIRSTMFILLLGIYVCIKNILPLIIIVSICTILDEFVVTPLKKMYHEKLVINKEIDKRTC